MVEVRFTEMSATAVDADVKTDITAGTGMCEGAKGIHPTLTTPNTDICSSAAIRNTAMKVCGDNQQSRGNSWGRSDRVWGIVWVEST